MKASQCINPEIAFLQPEDKGMTALGLLEEMNVREIPVVDNDNYIGLVHELDLLDYECIEGEIKNLNGVLKRPFIYGDDHLFEAVSLMAAEELTILPVLNSEGKYMGSIDQTTLIKKIAEAEGFKSAGGVLELEVSVHDYSMAEIARLVESNDLKILHSRVTATPDSARVIVTLKLNKPQLNAIIQTFERFGYTITASFQEDEFEEDLKKRYDGFLRYLNP